ncbi:unnamed protein product [Protopolystoma xenopodis]|uniref:Uncharacterized protein n=1 Tax=Protopolystoma xenopodis TaxID=117903 RepID=A0A448XRB0_9PLAT|nr:unnamed protein product [Protopolystoma xenopodis]
MDTDRRGRKTRRKNDRQKCTSPSSTSSSSSSSPPVVYAAAKLDSLVGLSPVKSQTAAFLPVLSSEASSTSTCSTALDAEPSLAGDLAASGPRTLRLAVCPMAGHSAGPQLPLLQKPSPSPPQSFASSQSPAILTPTPLQSLPSSSSPPLPPLPPLSPPPPHPPPSLLLPPPPPLPPLLGYPGRSMVHKSEADSSARNQVRGS